MKFSILIVVIYLFCNVVFASENATIEVNANQKNKEEIFNNNDREKNAIEKTPSTSIIKKSPRQFIKEKDVSQPTELIGEPQDLSGNILQVTLGLFVVLIVIAGAAWFARRFGHFNISSRGNLRIVGGLSMGARERVVLMQVGEQQLLLGVAPGRIETLHVLEQPINTSDDDNPQLGNALGRFSAVLKKVQGS